MKTFLALLMLILSIEASTYAADLEQDYALWSAIFYQHKLTEKWTGFFEIQGRTHGLQNNPVFERLMLRPALHYNIGNNFTVWGGYGYSLLFNPNPQPEHRYWQQIQHSKPYGEDKSFQLTERVRFEERDIDATSGLSLRMRLMLRLQYFTTPERTFSLVTSDELFQVLNSLGTGPSSGFDQNRVFLGVNTKISDGINLETGYLNILLNRKTPRPDRMSHALGLFLILNY